MTTLIGANNSGGTLVPASPSAPIPVSTQAYAGTPLGYVPMTPTAAVGLSPPSGARYAYLIPEGGMARSRDDGTDPTLATNGGNPIPNLTQVLVADLANYKIISGPGCTVHVSFYK